MGDCMCIYNSLEGRFNWLGVRLLSGPPTALQLISAAKGARRPAALIQALIHEHASRPLITEGN